MHLTIMFFLPFIFLKKFLKYGGTSGTSGTKPYQATITHGPLLARCNTTESARELILKSENKKPTENTIGKVGSSLV